MSDAAIAFEEAEQVLLGAAFEDCQPVWYSSNAVYLVQMCLADRRFPAIYKPERGERPLWDFPDMQLYRREVAAYRLAKLLGWPSVPPTVARDGPEGIGSLQLFVRHNPEEHFFVQRERPEFIPQLQRICVFDVITNNADRKGGACLLDGDGRIWGIDHGLCFHPQYKLRSVIWDWAGEPVDETVLEDVRRTMEAIATGDEATQPLHELLSGQEEAALLRRMRQFCEARRFPVPGVDRHYPWPLV